MFRVSLEFHILRKINVFKSDSYAESIKVFIPVRSICTAMVVRIIPINLSIAFRVLFPIILLELKPPSLVAVMGYGSAFNNQI